MPRLLYHNGHDRKLLTTAHGFESVLLIEQATSISYTQYIVPSSYNID